MLFIEQTTYIFFFNDTATTEIYTLSLHDALPISAGGGDAAGGRHVPRVECRLHHAGAAVPSHRPNLRHQHDVGDRKSTRLNSSHQIISYAVFCLKKKKLALTTLNDSLP